MSSSRRVASQSPKRVQVHTLVYQPLKRTNSGKNCTKVGNLCLIFIKYNIQDADYNLVGMVVITKEEHQQLNVETTHLVGDDDNYLVTIEVFHQLHCLVGYD